MTTDLFTERKLAVMQSRKGNSVSTIATNLGRSIGWVSKWLARYEAESWTGLKDHSRAPKRIIHETSPDIQAAICRIRMELEMEAELGSGLKYIGGRAIQARLKEEDVTPMPSVPTIERIICKAGLTKPRQPMVEKRVDYPKLQATSPHHLIQVDIVPHHLQGGQPVACFNAIDVVSRYPTGHAYAQKGSQTAAEFLIHVWQEIGIPQYTQVDNEGCFSGGTTHPYVLGKVVRLALQVGTELVFSPTYHPQSNGYVERFHQDYNRHVWKDTHLEDIAAVNRQSNRFFNNYRQWAAHSQLGGQTPADCHQQYPVKRLAKTFTLSNEKLPLYQGRIHFMRRVQEDGNIQVLNVYWPVPTIAPDTGVWVTLDLTTTGATLSIYDSAPDSPQRCLAAYPFKLTEPVVLPKQATLAEEALSQPELQMPDTPLPIETVSPMDTVVMEPAWPELIGILPQGPLRPTREVVKASERLILATIDHTARLTRRIFFTMF